MNYQEIYDRAVAAGYDAVEKLQVRPMTVTDGKQSWFVEDGVCGFAWIDFGERANGPLGKFMLGNKLARRGQAGTGQNKGFYVWVSDFNQSEQKKAAYADAFARVFKEAGFDAWAGSRLD